MARMFPIQLQRGAKPHPLQIPWDVAELAYSVYAAEYGRSQSLERLAERGGFGANEMDIFLPDWRERCDRLAQMEAEVERLRANQDSVPCPSCVDGIAGADYYGESVDCDLCGGTGRITGEMVKSLQSRLDDFVGRRMEADAENEQLRRERDAAMWHLIREWPVSGISVCLRSGYGSDMRWVTSREAAVEAVVESHRKEVSDE